MYKKNIIATVTSTELKEKEHIPNVTKDIDKTSIISLSTIANTLEDVNSETPRRLVDQLLMAQKKKKNPMMQSNVRKETYTLPSDRNSMLAGPIENSKKFDENINLEIPSTKLLLDNKTKNETIDVKQECSKMLSFASKEAESFTNACKEITLKEEETEKSKLFSFKQNAGL
jgi:phage pi2 protein 07